MLNYVETPNSNLVYKCAGSAPFTNPATTRTCMHTFCYDCIAEAVRHSPQCPIDRLPLSTVDLSPANPIVKHLVDELLVECPHQSAGCTHISQRQLLDSHLQHTCPYVTVPCPEIDCDQSILRKDCGKHANVCVHRSTLCQGCGISVKYGNLNDHYSECSSKVATCSLCTAEFPRSKTQEHIGICPNIEVDCVHIDNGCFWTGPRHELPSSHLPSCPYESLKGFFTVNTVKMSALVTENASLKQKVQSLEGLIQIMQREIQLMRNTLGPWYRFEIQRLDRASASSGHDGNQTPVGTSLNTTNQPPPIIDPVDAIHPPVHPADVDDTAAYFSVAPDLVYPEAHHHMPSAHRPFEAILHIQTHPHQRSLLFPVAPLNLGTSLEGTLLGLRESIAAISASVESLARRNDIALTTESMRINEELGSLRYAIQGIRLQLHHLMMDRNTQVSGRPGESLPVAGPVSIVPTTSIPSVFHPPMMIPFTPGQPGTKL
ncbi:hypothetical protein J3A83DRAFT_4508951 [Scleroderma citrinum]